MESNESTEWSREEAERVLEKLQEIGFLPSTWKPEGASSSQVIEGEKQRALREVYTNPMHLLDIYVSIVMGISGESV